MNISTNEHNKSDQFATETSNIIDIGLAREIHLIELQNLQAFIAHKEHELSVYENARNLIECQAKDDRCMIFLADNLFVLRTREQALEILDRQINFFKCALKSFRQERASLAERVALMERLSITNEGLVEIREPEDDQQNQKSGKIKGKRIEHTPKNLSSKTILKDDEASLKHLDDTINTNKIIKEVNVQNPQKPKGLSDQDYEKYVKLIDSLGLSEDSEEDKNDHEDDNNNKELNEEDQREAEREDVGEDENNDEYLINDEYSKQQRRVHFSDNLEEEPTGMKKERSILKNKNEHSPIDSTELRKMEQKEQGRIYSVSKEIVKDEIVERETTKMNKNMKSKSNKKQQQKKERRPVSRWKAFRDGLLHSDEDDFDDGIGNDPDLIMLKKNQYK